MAGTFFDAARKLFGRASPNAALAGVQTGGAAVTYGTALADSDGSPGAYTVPAHLDSSAEGTAVTLSMDAPVAAGDRLKVVTQGGSVFAVALGALARGDEENRAAASGANGIAKEVKAYIDDFKATADTIVHDKELTDELDKVRLEMSTTYASTADLDARLEEYSTTEQTSEAIKSTVSAEYIEGKVGSTYATKTEVTQASDALTLEISAKVDAEGARQAVSTMVRATADGVECGQVDEDGKRTTPYSVMSSDGAFNVFDKSGGWLTRVDGKGGFAKRSRIAALYTPSDAGFTDEPTVQLVGGEYLWSSSSGVSSGSVKMTSVPPAGAGEYAFLEFVFTDGKRTFSERLYKPALNHSTACTRAVSDGSCVYLATMTLTLSASSGSLLDTVTITNNKATTLAPSQPVDQLYDGKLWLTSVVGWG